MSESPKPNSFSPDDALPPVEAPSAGFLVQLFLIPGIIVTIIVVVWLLFHWLAQMGNDPREYVKKLRGNNEVRWQAAVNLAGALGNPENKALRNDAEMAQELSQILREEIDAGHLEKNDLALREYLCVALGKFNVDVPLPVLLKAATTNRDSKEDEVQLASIVGLGDLAASFREANLPLPDDAEVIKVLTDFSKNDATLLRGASALALGSWGGEAAKNRLAEMLNDSQPRVRYAAAASLARLGDVKAIETLQEMLSPDAPAADKPDADKPDVDIKITGRDDISSKLPNLLGLNAVAQLADANPNVDLSPLAPAVDRLTKSAIPEVRQNALAVQSKLARRAGK